MRFHVPSRAIALLAAAVASSALLAAPARADDAKPADTETAGARGGLTEADVTRAFKKYRKQVRDGNTVYCRNEKPLGTRIGKQVCYTEDQVLAMARNERDARNQMSQMNVCGGGSCTPGG